MANGMITDTESSSFSSVHIHSEEQKHCKSIPEVETITYQGCLPKMFAQETLNPFERVNGALVLKMTMQV